jgi:Pup-ligase protein
MTKHACSLEDPRVALLDLQYHDTRVGRGLYHLLARHGGVGTLVRDEVVERAKHRPPQTTRARLRGDFVRRANLLGWEYQVDWAYVRTLGPDSETILCPDPFLRPRRASGAASGLIGQDEVAPARKRERTTRRLAGSGAVAAGRSGPRPRPGVPGRAGTRA